MTREQFIEAAFAELLRIERGEVTVQLVEGDILLGKVQYLTSTGWKIVVFSDGDVWDYIHSIISPSGEQFAIWPEKPEADSESMRKLRSYRPPGDQANTIWGFMV
jgi:hypothetical protein